MVQYKCFDCGKDIESSQLRRMVRCPYCGGKMLFKKENHLGCIVVECKAREPLKADQPFERKVDSAQDCGGCLTDDVCLPIGVRKSKQFCDIDQTMKDQKEKESSCSNNFECSTNVCVNSQCISGSVIQKLLNWLASIFG